MSNDSLPVNHAGVAALLDELVFSDIVSGANVLIRHAGKEVLYHEAGVSDVTSGTKVTRHTLFRLFSMTKPITAAAVMMLVDDGDLRLDTPIVDHLPEFADLGVYVGQDGDGILTTPARPILVENLLNHTAGFSYWFYPDQPVAALYAKDPLINDERWRYDAGLGGHDALIRSLARLPLVAQPGERWHYSMSMDVAGVLIERVTGRPLDTFMKERIFDPLVMNDTGFTVAADQSDRLASLYKPKDGGGVELLERGDESPLLKPVPGLAGGGGLVSTIDDYSRFAEMLRRGGELDGRRLLSKMSVRAMMTNRLGPDHLGELPGLAAWGLGGTGDGLGFGLGGAVVVHPPANGVPAFRGEYSWGGAASTTFWIDPASQLTVVFMTQLQPPVGDVPRDRLHSAVYDSVKEPVA
ncbi:MAG: serine hydrolase domain-containing protein [Janthinobacterium lividum]